MRILRERVHSHGRLLFRAIAMAMVFGSVYVGSTSLAGRRSESAYEKIVMAFVEQLEAAARSSRSKRLGRLQQVYGRYFDLDGLGRRIATNVFGTAMSADQRRRLTGKLACRLATETARRAPGDQTVRWNLVGQRRSNANNSVAVRFERPRGRRETIVFDVKNTRRGMRITDIRSPSGRLSARFSQQVVKETKRANSASSVESWLSSKPCVSPR